MSKEVKVESNADGLGVAKGMPVIATVNVGDYQGQTVVLLDDEVNKTVHVYVIGYGSCGGCDWFEDFYGEPPTYKDCLEAWQDEKARYIYPKADFKAMSPKKFFGLLFEKDSGYQGMNPEYGWTEHVAEEIIEAVKRLGSQP